MTWATARAGATILQAGSAGVEHAVLLPGHAYYRNASAAPTGYLSGAIQ